MPKAKSTTGVTTPANDQKGKKYCTQCHDEKKMTDFYLSYSPMYSLDKRTPICKECCKSSALNEDGSINFEELKKMLMHIDKPLYYDQLFSATESVKTENSYLSDEEVNLHGYDILSKYFTLIAMRQDRARSFSESERDGFIHQNTNRPQKERDEISKKYSHLFKNSSLINTTCITSNTSTLRKDEVKWSKQDKQNMKYVISTVGYDPFEDNSLSESDRKYCFNVMSGYCDTEGVKDDGNKRLACIRITTLQLQCQKIDELISRELTKDSPDEQKIQKLTSTKSQLISSVSTLCKDNNISSAYNGSQKAGKNTLTQTMQRMFADGIEGVKVDLFDIETCKYMKQVADCSNASIMEQLNFDDNELSQMIKDQRELIQSLQSELDEIKEKYRICYNELIDIKNRKR